MFEERLMLSKAELEDRIRVEGLAKCYWDPQLKYDYTSYCEFIKSLHDRRMIRFSMCKLGDVGAFFVSKKSGKLRLIIDCRQLNQNHRIFLNHLVLLCMWITDFFVRAFPEYRRIRGKKLSVF